MKERYFHHLLLKSPYKENLGLWTDEDLSFEDYEKFNISKIDSTEFEKFWEKFSL